MESAEYRKCHAFFVYESLRYVPLPFFARPLCIHHLVIYIRVRVLFYYSSRPQRIANVTCNSRVDLREVFCFFARSSLYTPPDNLDLGVLNILLWLECTARRKCRTPFARGSNIRYVPFFVRSCSYPPLDNLDSETLTTTLPCN